MERQTSVDRYPGGNWRVGWRRFLTFAFLAALSGCSPKTDGKYEGKWSIESSVNVEHQIFILGPNSSIKWKREVVIPADPPRLTSQMSANGTYSRNGNRLIVHLVADAGQGWNSILTIPDKILTVEDGGRTVDYFGYKLKRQ